VMVSTWNSSGRPDLRQARTALAGGIVETSVVGVSGLISLDAEYTGYRDLSTAACALLISEAGFCGAGQVTTHNRVMSRPISSLLSEPGTGGQPAERGRSQRIWPSVAQRCVVACQEA
jgi:hypothetical protein